MTITAQRSQLGRVIQNGGYNVKDEVDDNVDERTLIVLVGICRSILLNVTIEIIKEIIHDYLDIIEDLVDDRTRRKR